MDEQPIKETGEKSSVVGIVITTIIVTLVVVGIAVAVSNSSSQNSNSSNTVASSTQNQITNVAPATTQSAPQQAQATHKENYSQPAQIPTPTQNTITQQAPAQQGYSASTLAAELGPQLAYITCNWYNNYGDVLFSQSSNGILGPAGSNGSYFITTVLGGISNTSYMGGSVIYPSSCSIQFPAGASLYSGGLSNFTVSRDSSGSGPVGVANPNVDFGQVIIKNPNAYVIDYARKVNYCSARSSIGDSIAVFGWPINSNNETLTGSITGISGYYDATNITVPNGMQGSTAVSLTNGCVIGQINSSGQIADIQGLSYVLGW